MVRKSLKTKTPLSRKILGFALINIIPIGALVWLAWSLRTDRISLDDLPAGLDRNMVWLAVAIALLFVVVSFLLPFFHMIASWLERSLKRSAQIRSEAGVVRTAWEWLLWPFRQLFFRIFWLARFVLFIASFTIIIVCVVFIIRFFTPDFGQEWVDLDGYLARAEDYVTDR